MKTKTLFGNFGEQFLEFKGQPKKAIQHLKRIKRGECIAALHRDDIGYIDIVWGEVKDPIKHTGFGLAHIIDKHGEDIKKLGFDIENFIPIIIQFGNLKKTTKDKEIILESKGYRVIIEQYAFGSKKNWLLTAFNLTKKPKK